MPGKRFRDNILCCFVDDIVSALLWPIGCKYLKCLSAQQQIKWPAHLLGHGLAQKIIEVGDCPATVRKVTAGVFGGSTGCLHDAVQCQKSEDNNLSHGSDSSTLCIHCKLVVYL